jgi:hypothetical protein
MTDDHLDDRTAEALLQGHPPVDRPELDDVAALAAEVRELASGPTPLPTGALARLLEDGFTPAGDHPGVRQERPTGGRRRLTAGSSLTARAAGALAFVLAGVTGAAAADALPAPVQDRVASVVERTTAIDLPDSADHRPDPRQHGPAVAADAKDGGVDGRAMGDQAHDEAAPPAVPSAKPSPLPGGPPTAPGQHGLDNAADQPAGTHVPTAVPPQGTARPARPSPHATSTSPVPRPDRPTPRQPSTASPSIPPSPR